MERLRYYNGLALVKGFSKSLANSLESVGVSDALGTEAVEVRPPRPTWPSAQAAAAYSATVAAATAAAASAAPSASRAAAAVPAGSPSSKTVFACVPMGEVLGMRSSEEGGIRPAARAAAPSFTLPPRTLHDPRQFPVLSANGYYVLPSPSPVRRRRPQSAAEAAAAASGPSSSSAAASSSGGVASVPAATRALDDHLVFSSQGITTATATASIGNSSTSSLGRRREAPATLAEQRGAWLHSGAAFVATALPEVAAGRGVQQPPPEVLFPSSASVAGQGKRHGSGGQLTGSDMAALMRLPGGQGGSSGGGDAVGVASAPRVGIPNMWEKTLAAEPKRRYLRGPPQEITQSGSNPARPTAIY